MMNLSTIIQYLYPELISRVHYLVRDDSQGAYIAEWNTTKYPKPTKEYLEAKRTDFQKAYNNDQQIQKRIQAYPKIGEQLDMLWHAMELGEIPKANEFYTAIDAVKTQYPKS